MEVVGVLGFKGAEVGLVPGGKVDVGSALSFQETVNFDSILSSCSCAACILK